jgi:hypothetical protein
VDEIRLTIPDDPAFYPVAHLVLGGIGSRLTVDGLDDLRVAVDSLLDRAAGAGEVTLTVRVEDDRLIAVLGPFDAAALERALADDRAGELGLRRILDTVVDSARVTNGDGAAWVALEKRLTG